MEVPTAVPTVDGGGTAEQVAPAPVVAAVPPGPPIALDVQIGKPGWPCSKVRGRCRSDCIPVAVTPGGAAYTVYDGDSPLRCEDNDCETRACVVQFGAKYRLSGRVLTPPTMTELGRFQLRTAKLLVAAPVIGPEHPLFHGANSLWMLARKPAGEGEGWFLLSPEVVAARLAAQSGR